MTNVYTYPEMNKIVKALLKNSDEPMLLYAVARIEELERAVPQWIPFRVRDLDEEEQAEHPEWDWILEGELPEDGQRILVNVKYRGHESVQMDEYYNDNGCYLDSGYEIGTEVTHWMPLPEPPGGEDND